MWVTKKMHIESSHHLKAIIDDISDQIEIIDENLNGEEMKIAVIHRSLRTIDRAREKMENLALNNLEAIEAAVRGIESSQESWSLRQEMAFELQTRHISPMSDIIDVSGVLMKTIDRVKVKLNPKLDIQGILLTMYDRRNKLSAEVEKEARNYFKDKVYQTVIPRNVRLSEAPSHGVPVLIYDKSCSGSKSYYSFTDEFIIQEKTTGSAA